MEMMVVMVVVVVAAMVSDVVVEDDSSNIFITLDSLQSTFTLIILFLYMRGKDQAMK